MNILRPSEVCKKIGLSRTTLWRLEQDGDFPARIQLSIKAVGYDEEAIEEWLVRRGLAAAGQPGEQI